MSIPIDVISKEIDNYANYSKHDRLETDDELEEFLDSLKAFSDFAIGLLGKYRYTFSNVERRNITELGNLLL